MSFYHTFRRVEENETNEKNFSGGKEKRDVNKLIVWIINEGNMYVHTNNADTSQEEEEEVAGKTLI